MNLGINYAFEKKSAMKLVLFPYKLPVSSLLSLFEFMYDLC